MPQWSPALSTGKRGRPHQLGVALARAAMEPGAEHREEEYRIEAARIASLPPQWSPALSTGKRRLASPPSKLADAAAMEPGAEHREETPPGCRRRCP